jgi:hypothetical protein
VENGSTLHQASPLVISDARPSASGAMASAAAVVVGGVWNQTGNLVINETSVTGAPSYLLQLRRRLVLVLTDKGLVADALVDLEGGTWQQWANASLFASHRVSGIGRLPSVYARADARLARLTCLSLQWCGSARVANGSSEELHVSRSLRRRSTLQWL